jgi:hypothetical protein
MKKIAERTTRHWIARVGSFVREEGVKAPLFVNDVGLSIKHHRVAIEKYIKSRGYKIGTLVAFSGEVTHHSLKDQGTRQLPLGGGEAPKLPPLSEAGSGSLHEKEKVRLEEIIAKVNDLFEGDLTDDDQLVYVNNVIKGKLLESQELVLQASNNTKAQFANSPTLSKEIMNAVMDALVAHSTMSKQAIDSERVREGLKDVLLGPGQLYEALRNKGSGTGEAVGE